MMRSRLSLFRAPPDLKSWQLAFITELRANCHVRLGSKADVTLLNFDVRFTPESGHPMRHSECLLWAITGLMRCSKDRDGPAAIDLPTRAEEEQVRLSVRPSAFQSEMILFSSLRRLGCILRYYMRRP
jgi:hypothetical protein